jgi:hypothetical protein
MNSHLAKLVEGVRQILSRELAGLVDDEEEIPPTFRIALLSGVIDVPVQIHQMESTRCLSPDAPADLGAPGADRLTDDGGRRPSGRREGARRERCLKNVGGGVFVGRNAGRHGGGREVRPRRQEHSIRRSRAGVGCCQSWEVKSEMSVISRTRHVKRNVKRWRGGHMVLRWTAAAILEAVKGFRRLKGHKDMPKLVAGLRARDQQLGIAVSVENVA